MDFDKLSQSAVPVDALTPHRTFSNPALSGLQKRSVAASNKLVCPQCRRAYPIVMGI
jgi:uncharacterized protein YbaR (Trm112 family)